MPVLKADAKTLTIRFELHEQPEHVVRELVEEVGEDAEVLPYSIRTFVEVDGKQLGVISRGKIEVDATSIPRIHFDIAHGLDPNTPITARLRNSIQQTVERLRAFPFVAAFTPFNQPQEPEPPPGLTVWERLMADDD